MQHDQVFDFLEDMRPGLGRSLFPVLSAKNIHTVQDLASCQGPIRSPMHLQWLLQHARRTARGLHGGNEGRDDKLNSDEQLLVQVAAELENNRCGVRQLRDPCEDTMPYTGRQAQISQVLDQMKACVNQQKGDRVELLAVESGSRSGKSRFARELSQIVQSISNPQDPLFAGEVFILDFNRGGDAITRLDLENKWYPEVFLGMRLAAKYIFSCELQALQATLSRLQGRSRQWFELYRVMDILAQQQRRACGLPEAHPVAQLLVLDEIQMLSGLDGPVKEGLAHACAAAAARWVQEGRHYLSRGIAMLLGTGLPNVVQELTGFGQDTVAMPPLQPQEAEGMLQRSLLEVYHESRVQQILSMPGVKAQLALNMGMPGWIDWLRGALTTPGMQEAVALPQTDARQRAIVDTIGQYYTCELESLNRASHNVEEFGCDAAVNMLLLTMSGVMISMEVPLGAKLQKIVHVNYAMAATGTLFPVHANVSSYYARLSGPFSVWMHPYLQHQLATTLLDHHDFKKAQGQGLPPEAVTALVATLDALPCPLAARVHAGVLEKLMIAMELNKRWLLHHWIHSAHGMQAFHTSGAALLARSFTLSDLFPQGIGAAALLLNTEVVVAPLLLARDTEHVFKDTTTFDPPMQGYTLDLMYPEASGSASADSWLAEGFAVLTNKDPHKPTCPLADLRITHRSMDGRTVLMLYHFEKRTQPSKPAAELKSNYEAVSNCIAGYNNKNPSNEVDFVYIWVTTAKVDEPTKSYAVDEATNLLLLDSSSLPYWAPVLNTLASAESTCGGSTAGGSSSSTSARAVATPSSSANLDSDGQPPFVTDVGPAVPTTPNNSGLFNDGGLSEIALQSAEQQPKRRRRKIHKTSPQSAEQQPKNQQLNIRSSTALQSAQQQPRSQHRNSREAVVPAAGSAAGGLTGLCHLAAHAALPAGAQ